MRLVLTMKVDCVPCEVRNVAEKTIKNPSIAVEYDFCGRFSFTLLRHYMISV